MNIHEHQAKAILAEFGLPVPKGFPAFSVDEAVAAAGKLPGPVYVVKAQIHAGGRGKAGGVKVVKSLDAVKAEAERMLGLTLVTKQTGEAGRLVRRLYVEDGANIAKEYYLSVLVDRVTGRVAFVASSEGGMDIEEVAEHTPEKIVTVAIDPTTGVTAADSAALAKGIGMEGALAEQLNDFCVKLYRAFVEKDMSMLELNPLIATGEGKLLCLDAKISFDTNAHFRHKEYDDLRDLTEEDEKEIEASKYDLAYIALDGDIGCMVNGAGLAMATMDIIKLYGRFPANFLDVGGGASRKRSRPRSRSSLPTRR